MSDDPTDPQGDQEVRRRLHDGFAAVPPADPGGRSLDQKKEVRVSDDDSLVVNLGKHSLQMSTSRPQPAPRSASGLYPPQ